MVSVVLGLLFCVGLALAVMALVAVPARRQGRDVLSERGEQVVESIRERLLALPAETRVLTGHGDESTIGDEAPHLQEWIDRGH